MYLIPTMIFLSIMFLVLIAAVFINLHFCSCSTEDAPRVNTKLGPIRGYYKISGNNNKYEAFEGVPYALPPIGEKRFEIPEPIKPWSQELVATKIAGPCSSAYRKMNSIDVRGNEDCLYLNIYSPLKRHGLLPVTVYIHGGAFQYGTPTTNDARFLVDHDIIYVSIHYRVGILGFFSTGDEIVPGNMGLKDQSLALRWIKENIESFGGDPNRVTITGSSAGAASVHLHYLSPLSKGLFQNGISFSGTAFKCWAQTDHAQEKAMKLGVAMGCPTHDTKSLVQCLKELPARNLTGAVSLFMPWQLMPFTPFGPIIEKPSAHAFMTRPPAEIFRSGDYYDVPWITSLVSEEGLYPIAEFAENDTALRDLDEHWEERAPFLLDFNYTTPKEDQPAIARKIRQHYFGDKPINRQNIGILIRLGSDRLFNTDSLRAVMAHAKMSRSPVRLYYYSYRAAHSLSDSLSRSTNNYGVSHTDDVFMVLGLPHMTPIEREGDLAMQRLLIQSWVSFAREGLPDVGMKWSRVNSLPGNFTEDNFNYLHIAGPNNVKEEHSINFVQTSFWDSLKLDHNTHGTTEYECN